MELKKKNLFGFGYGLEDGMFGRKAVVRKESMELSGWLVAWPQRTSVIISVAWIRIYISKIINRSS